MKTRSYASFVLVVLSAMLSLLISQLAMGRHEISDAPIHFYKEEGSFGSIRPDELAKPAETDMRPQRHARAIDREGFDDEPRASVSMGKPKYRQIYEELTKRERGYGDEEDLGVSIGIGLGFKTFSASAGVHFPFSRYAGWGVEAAYISREEKDVSSSRTLGDGHVLLKLPNPTPITPFLTLGAGLEAWRRAKDDGEGLEVFDESFSPTINSSMGGSIRLARYVALVGAMKSTTYTADPPRVFTDDHRAAESRTDERFDLGIALMF